MLEFLDRHTKNLQAADCLASWCLACVSCCSCCLSYILTYVNRQAYVMIGVKGTGYCAAANRAAELTVKVSELQDGRMQTSAQEGGGAFGRLSSRRSRSVT